MLPEEERAAVERHIRERGRLGEDLRGVECDVTRRALKDETMKRLMPVPGIDMIVAAGLTVAIGDIGRFASSLRPPSG